MTVTNPTTGTTITTAWGVQVATDVNGLLARATALEAINAGTRLGTAEGEIDALQAATVAIGTRNGHTYNPGQTIAPGAAYQFNLVGWISGITDVGDQSGWTVVTAGVYSVSYRVEDNAGGTSGIDVGGNIRSVGDTYGSSLKFGQWTGFVSAGQMIRVMHLDGTTGAYITGLVDIFRVAQGG